jgi:glycosyltransferase involved in cell wall biosynthesis
MPIYENSEFLEASILSILNQTYKNFEFIILDDGSTENIEKIVNVFNDSRIRFYKNEKNIGLTKSLNICLDLVIGDIIARQDGDDISLNNRFERQIKCFNKDVGLVSSWARSMSHIGDIESHEWFDNTTHVEEDFIKNNLSLANYIVGPMAMYTREVFEKIGYYEESLITAQDYNYWLRIIKFFDIRIVKEDLGFIRRNNNSVRKKYKFDTNWLISKCNELANNKTIVNNRDKFKWENNF